MILLIRREVLLHLWHVIVKHWYFKYIQCRLNQWNTAEFWCQPVVERLHFGSHLGLKQSSKLFGRIFRFFLTMSCPPTWIFLSSNFGLIDQWSVPCNVHITYSTLSFLIWNKYNIPFSHWPAQQLVSWPRPKARPMLLSLQSLHSPRNLL